MSQKLDVTVKAVTDVSRYVEATEECQKEGGASLTSRPLHLLSQKVGQATEDPDQNQDVAEVHWQVAKRLGELPAYYEAMTEEDYTFEEEEEEQLVQ